MKIAIGGDHAGYQLKETLKKHISAAGHKLVDFGPENEESCDYPDIAHPLAVSVALCWNEELAALARQHNDANVLALPARFINVETAIKCVDAFLNNEFEGGRHQRRVDKIAVK